MLPLPAKEKMISICDASIDITLDEITKLLLTKTSIISINHFPKNDCYMPSRMRYLFVMHAYISKPLHSKFFNSKWMEYPRVEIEPTTSQIIAALRLSYWGTTGDNLKEFILFNPDQYEPEVSCATSLVLLVPLHASKRHYFIKFIHIPLPVIY